MNILVTTFSFPSSRDNIRDGSFVLSECIAYTESSANVRVIMPHYPGADKVERFEGLNEIYRFQYFWPESLQRVKKPNTAIYVQKSLFSILQIPFLIIFFSFHILRLSRWADIIHAQWTVTALMALPAKWLRKKKIVVTSRGSDLRIMPLWLNRFICRNVDAIIDCFGEQRWNKENRRKFPGNYVKLPQLVSFNKEKKIPQEFSEFFNKANRPFIILYVGRLDKAKIEFGGFPFMELIDAAKILKEQKKNFRILYIGYGESGIIAEMNNRISELQLDDVVTLLGRKDNIINYMQYANLGIGGVVFNAVNIEFAFSGTPQILVDIGYNRDTSWQDRNNAIFCKPNDPRGLSDAIAFAMDDPIRLQKISEEAKNMISPYAADTKKGGEIYIAFFEKLINESKKSYIS